MQIVITLLAIALLYVWVIVRSDTHRFVVREYEIASPKIVKPVTLCVLSDLHEKDYGNGNARLAEAILEQNPDAVLSAGDLITAHHLRNDCDDNAVRSLVKRVCERVPVFLGTGNHEMKLAFRTDVYGDALERYEDDVRQAGARILRNEKPFPLTDNLDLAALDLPNVYFTHGSQKPLRADEVEVFIGGKPDPSHFTVLIAHESSRFPAYADWGADLVLSGHVHGGVARLFGRGVVSPSLRPFPLYDGGAYVRRGQEAVVRHPAGKMLYLREGERAMVQSRGLGTHTIHVRFLNPGELVVVKLRPHRETEG